MRNRKPPEHMRKAAEEARKEAHEVADRERDEAQVRRRRGRKPREIWAGRLGRPSYEVVTVRVRGAALELRRRAKPIVAPVVAPFAATLGASPPMYRQACWRWSGSPPGSSRSSSTAPSAWAAGSGRRVGAVAGAIGAFLARVVTPVNAVAVVAAAAAIGLAVSQFFDYRGLAIDSTQYGGELGGVVSAPITELETAGSAHLFALVPLAVAALVLIALTALGRWRLGRAVALLGVVGIAVTLLIDLPQGLEEGRTGISYLGTEPQLLEGFWAQISLLGGAGLLRAAARALREAGGARERGAGEATLSPAPRVRPAWRREPRPAWGEHVNRLPRTESLLVLACAAAAAMLAASQFISLFELTPPGGEALRSVDAADQHGYATLVLAAFALVMLVVGIAARSETLAQVAAFAVAACGVVALLIFLVGDLPDANKIGTLDDANESFIDAKAEPQAGFWLELVGALVLAVCGGRARNPEALGSAVPRTGARTKHGQDAG